MGGFSAIYAFNGPLYLPLCFKPTMLNFMKKTIFMLLVLMATFAAHAQTYLYEEQDGTRWITNQKLKSKNFTFLEQYGRPTAVSSCRGVSEAAIMERAKKHMPHVYKYAHKFKIDPMLVKALIRAERFLVQVHTVLCSLCLLPHATMAY